MFINQEFSEILNKMKRRKIKHLKEVEKEVKMNLEKFKESISGFRQVTAVLILTYFLAVFSATDVLAERFVVNNVSEFQTVLTTAAINSEDDTINVTAGTYIITTTLTYDTGESFSLLIVGAGAGSTILDGGNSTQILNLHTTLDGADLEIRALTFQNGNNSDTVAVGGGASFVADEGNILISDCSFIGNMSSQNAGGLFTATGNGSINMTHCTFEANNAGEDAGGGYIYIDGNGEAIINGNTFRDNITGTAPSPVNPDGGGMMLYGMAAGISFTIEDNIFINNQAGLGGGGCYLRNPFEGTVSFKNNQFSGNSTLIGDGGGLHIDLYSAILNYSGNTHINNTSAVNGGGACIFNETGTLNLTGNTFTGNIATSNGGGANVFTESGRLAFNRNVLVSNTAGNIGGGLSAAIGSGTLDVSNNTFYGDSASEGSGIYFYFGESTSQANVFNNILWYENHPAIAYSGAQAVTATYSDIESGTGESWFGTGCIDQDPLFADPEGDDFHLTWVNFPIEDETKSPCIDAGDPASPPDPDGTQADMGVFYFTD